MDLKTILDKKHFTYEVTLVYLGSPHLNSQSLEVAHLKCFQSISCYNILKYSTNKEEVQIKILIFGWTVCQIYLKHEKLCKSNKISFHSFCFISFLPDWISNVLKKHHRPMIETCPVLAFSHFSIKSSP